MKGDWISLRVGKEKTIPCRVEGTFYNTIEVNDGLKIWRVNPRDLNQFEPILLNLEILISMGFREDYAIDEVAGYRLVIGDWEKVVSLWFIERKNMNFSKGFSISGNNNFIITYLHELQHVLLLAKITVNFSLFTGSHEIDQWR